MKDTTEAAFFWSVALDHPAFPGHFPGHPIVPGVVLLDAALYGIGQAHGWSEAQQRGIAVAACKFLRPAEPGAVLRIAHRQQANGAIHFEITDDGRVVASGRLAPPERKAAA